LTTLKPAGIPWTGHVLLLLTLSFIWAAETHAEAKAYAEIESLNSAINKAGRQRMLTQRIVKAYCLVGLKVQTSRHRKQLDKAVTLFEDQLNQLKAFAPNDEIRTGLAQVETLWGPFKTLATGDPTQEGATKLLELDGPLLASAHEVVQLLEQQSTTPAGRLVNLAGRQRMLSQRLAKFYMARAWSIELPNMADQMKTAAGEFEDALNTELITSASNTPEIQQELNKANKQWALYKRGLKLEEDSGNHIPVIMAATSENLLKIMNKITGMYAQLPSK